MMIGQVELAAHVGMTLETDVLVGPGWLDRQLRGQTICLWPSGGEAERWFGFTT